MMAVFGLVVHFKNRRCLLNIAINETLSNINKGIASICNIDLTDGEHIIEILDKRLNDYVVLTEQYLIYLKKGLPTTRKLEGRFTPYRRSSKY